MHGDSTPQKRQKAKSKTKKRKNPQVALHCPHGRNKEACFTYRRAPHATAFSTKLRRGDDSSGTVHMASPVIPCISANATAMGNGIGRQIRDRTATRRGDRRCARPTQPRSRRLPTHRYRCVHRIARAGCPFAFTCCPAAVLSSFWCQQVERMQGVGQTVRAFPWHRRRNTPTHAGKQAGRGTHARRHAADVGRCSRHDLPSFRPVRSCVRRRTKRSRGSSGRRVGRSVTRPASDKCVCVTDRPTDRSTDRCRRRRRRRRRPDDWRLHQQQQSNSGISTKLQLGPLWPARPLARSLAGPFVRSFTASLTHSLTHCQRTPQKIALPAKGDVSADYPLNEWINDCISAGRPD